MEQIEALYNRYFSDVFLYMKALSKSEDIAEEVTQETFFKAIKSIGKFKGDCNIRVWLCQIAKNTYYDLCRKKHTVSLDEAEEVIADDNILISEQLEDAQQTMKIHKLLHTMEEPYKEVFSLRIFGELSFRQIGEVFGKTESWARVTFHRAKVKLIDEIEEE